MKTITGKNGETLISSLSDEIVAEVLKTIRNKNQFASSLEYCYREWGEFKRGQLYWAHKLALETLAEIVDKLKIYQPEGIENIQLSLRDLIVNSPRNDIINLSGVNDALAKELLWWGRVLTVNEVINWSIEMNKKGEKQ